jgi:hypothetical protein
VQEALVEHRRQDPLDLDVRIEVLRIIDSVFSSWTSPRSERYSHCTGTMTPFDATSALIVSSPSDGGVSIRM